MFFFKKKLTILSQAQTHRNREKKNQTSLSWENKLNIISNSLALCGGDREVVDEHVKAAQQAHGLLLELYLISDLLLESQ